MLNTTDNFSVQGGGVLSNGMYAVWSNAYINPDVKVCVDAKIYPDGLTGQSVIIKRGLHAAGFKLHAYNGDLVIMLLNSIIDEFK